jgi:hypothetical protein
MHLIFPHLQLHPGVVREGVLQPCIDRLPVRQVEGFTIRSKQGLHPVAALGKPYADLVWGGQKQGPEGQPLKSAGNNEKRPRA